MHSTRLCRILHLTETIGIYYGHTGTDYIAQVDTPLIYSIKSHAPSMLKKPKLMENSNRDNKSQPTTIKYGRLGDLFYTIIQREVNALFHK